MKYYYWVYYEVGDFITDLVRKRRGVFCTAFEICRYVSFPLCCLY